MLHAADQEIVYRDQKRFTYRMLRDRIGRLANGLKELGVRPGDTVGVMDQLDRTSVGKIDKKLLRTRYTQDE